MLETVKTLSTNYHNNAVKRIQLYKLGDTWVFDDTHLGLTAEPFVAGASETIQVIVDNLKHLTNKETPVIQFAEFLPKGKYDAVIKLNENMGQSASYKYEVKKGVEMDLWLCPVLTRYFKTPPDKIYVKFLNK